MAFLKDVLLSPLNHSSILIQLLEFTVLLGSKVDNTNFGEQQKMRRELGDLFVRLLSAITTIRPNNAAVDSARGSVAKIKSGMTPTKSVAEPKDLTSVLVDVLPQLPKVLLEHDRMLSTASVISTHIIGSRIKSKLYPDSLDNHILDLLVTLGQIPEASKPFRKDVYDAFNDNRFFNNAPGLDHLKWLPILRQWVIGDKERIPELLSRLTAPATAGIVFGVGATGARLEADRKTQLNLRRITLLFLSTPNDACVVNLPNLQEKIIELFHATSASSPSSITRAELYMTLRALVLKCSTNHLTSFWPVISAEISEALTSAMPDSDQESPLPLCLLQLCKLIDVLVLLGFDDFQLQEWLFITDTTDAVYRPAQFESSALTDLLAEGLDAGAEDLEGSHLTVAPGKGKRGPLLRKEITRDMRREDIVNKVVRPFLRQLSILSFEAAYDMEVPDLEACEKDLVDDLFDEATLVQ